VAHSLRRNHPEVTVAWVEDNLDLTNAQVLAEAFATVNGLVAKVDEDQAPGEAPGQSTSTT
jgi:hypothetical protein